MPSYKNELTQQIIYKAFEKKSELKIQPYVQIQVLYEGLCNMVKENGSKSRFKSESKFDQDIFEQMLEESQLIKSENNLLVKVESFCINLMRAQISLNEKLKSIHLHIQNLEVQRAQIQGKGRPANRFDPEFEERQNLPKQIEELKNQKMSIEKDLFNLRLTFIGEEQLKGLTKRLQSSKSNPYFKPLERQYFDNSISKKQNDKIPVPSYRSIGPDKSSPSKKVSNTKNKDIIWTVILILTLILVLCQSVIAILQTNNFLNLVMFGLMIWIFLKQKYSKMELKFFMAINALSLVMDIVILFVRKSYFWTEKPHTLLQGNHHWRLCVLVLILISLIGKIFLEICLAIQVFKQLPRQISVNFLCFSFRLYQMQRPDDRDIIHTTLAKLFS